MKIEDFVEFISKSKTALSNYDECYVASKYIKSKEIIIDHDKLEKFKKNINDDEGKLYLTEDKLLEIISAILSGKHIILYGPPGTGKTTIAQQISDLFNCDYDLVTATSDWSTYHTVGGLKITSKDGVENFEPINGHITNAIIKCCNEIGQEMIDKANEYSGYWLIIDELNRADMDKAFGQVFTALDPDNSLIKLDFHESQYKKELFVPRRFRIIGTINNYDKDFLYHISYALMRRFAYIYIGIPENEVERKRELNNIKNKVVEEVERKLQLSYSVNDLDEEFKDIIEDLKKIVYMIRPKENKAQDELSREIGFAQFKDTLKYVVVSYKSLSEQSILNVNKKDLLDISLASNIIPQLEGLNKTQLDNFRNKLLEEYTYLDKTNRTLLEHINSGF
ncbi:MAG: AAA family ATPase [bacterium]